MAANPGGISSSITQGPIRRTLLLLALPVLTEQMLNTFVGIFDTFLAGRISAAATSAIGIGAYVAWLASMIVMLVGTGTTALVSRHFGAGRRDLANHFTNQSVGLAVAQGTLLFILLYACAPWFTRYINLTGDAYDIAVRYLRIDCTSYVAMSITMVGCAALRGAGDMRTPMLIFAVVNVFNIVASCALVFGAGPLPPLGVTGIVLGTVAARTVGAGITVAILLYGRAGLRISLRQMRVEGAAVRRILRIGVPAATDSAVMWAGHFALLAIIGRLALSPYGEAMFAAHVVAVRVEALTYLPAFAWGTALATMIGQALGANDPARAKRAGHEAVLQCGLLSILIAVAFYYGSGLIYVAMSNDALVQAAGTEPFRVLALLQPFLVASIVYIGGLRGAGDTRTPLWITFTGVALVRLPLGYYFGIVCNGGLMGAWIGMCGDMIWRAVLATIRFTRGRWVHTKV